MLIYFKVSNSRSIGDELEFSAIATDDTILPQNTIDVPKYGIKLLKTMAIFGANASGKSNILKAFLDAFRVIAQPDFSKTEFDFNYNKNNPRNKNGIISYHFCLLLNDTIFNYSFSHNKKMVLEEKLTENINSYKEKTIYSRKYSDSTLKYEWSPISYFNKQNIEFFRKSTPVHKLFLSIANNPVNPDEVEKATDLEQVYLWFRKQATPHISIQSPGKIGPIYLVPYIQKSTKNKELLIQLLNKVNIDIQNIEVIEVQKEEKYQKILFKGSYYSIKTYHKSGLKAGLKNSKMPYDLFTEESHGTLQFMSWVCSWLNFFQEDSKPKIFIIDELGTSLHPKLTMFLMELFADSEINPYNAQLIFTTHEVKLMDKTIMRPDQLYLVNKDKEGNTTIERASDYEDIEKYTRLDTLYMSGGMSGIPMILNTPTHAITTG